MYLSRVEIDYENRKKIKDLNHLGAYHSWVEESFPQEIKKQERNRKLWRIDQLGEKKYLLIVSPDKPEKEALEKYGRENTAITKNYDDFLEKIKEGQKYKFRIVVNPTISISNKEEKEKRGRTFPLLKEEDQRKYLLDRAEKNGFKLDKEEFYLVRSSFEKVLKKDKKALNLVKAEFQGSLTITDQKKFVALLTNGLGKKKAYGFGMMTIIPE